MTETDVIKALLCCGSEHTKDTGEKTCIGCPMNERHEFFCMISLYDEALAVINSLRSERDKLSAELKEINNNNTLM